MRDFYITEVTDIDRFNYTWDTDILIDPFLCCRPKWKDTL